MKTKETKKFTKLEKIGLIWVTSCIAGFITLAVLSNHGIIQEHWWYMMLLPLGFTGGNICNFCSSDQTFDEFTRHPYL